MNPVSALTTVSGTLNGASSILQGLSSIGTVLLGGDFWSQLRPVSFRGVPFGVLEGDAVFGRRNAIHTYPFRDGAWVEDMGKQSRRVILIGFVVGDDAITRRDRLINAVESPGDGELIHATLGRMTVNVLEFSSHERWDKGRLFEIRLVCMTSVPRIWPSSGVSTSDAVTSAVAALAGASTAAFAANIITALQYSASVAQQAVATSQAWASRALSIARAASGAYNLIAGAGSLASGFSHALAQFVAASAATQSQAAAVGNAATATTFATGAQLATVTAIVSAGDAKRQINAAVILSSFQTPFSATTVGIPQAGTTGADQTSMLFRRAAVAQMMQAAANYKPASNDEAAVIKSLIASVIDTAITDAGDAGDDGVYVALIELKTAGMQAMTKKSVALPNMILYSFQSSIPDLVLAQRIYQDVSRADELAQGAKAIHPAFMPRQFKALSS